MSENEQQPDPAVDADRTNYEAKPADPDQTKYGLQPMQRPSRARREGSLPRHFGSYELLR